MQSRLLAPFLVLLVLAAPVAGRAPAREIDNVAAFARLFGVVRYFYPSDAAATIDWNAFAVYGTSQVRVAPDAKALETALRSLVDSLGPNILIGAKLPSAAPTGPADPTLVSWRYLGPAVAPGGGRGPYAAKRTNRAAPAGASSEGFVTMMQTVPALPYRGKAIRFSGRVRATAKNEGGAALWLRVDRPDQQMGFFDNMGNRPIRDPEWREYAIEGTVAADAVNVAFGAMASGAVMADFDSMSVSIRDASGAWTPIDIQDAGFEAGEATSGWTRAGTASNAVVTRPSDQAPEGRQFLRIGPPAGGIAATGPDVFDAPALGTGTHFDIDLGSGLRARVPLALTEAQASSDASKATALDALRKALSGVAGPRDSADVNTRLADVVVSWNVFQHFYPYWDVVKVDWRARLEPHLSRAYDATTREGQHRALRLLVADLQDGHGGVNDILGGRKPSAIPVQLSGIEGKLVVTASAVADVPVGSLVTSIAGEPADKRLAELMQLWSGTAQWREFRALQEMRSCGTAKEMSLELDTGKGSATAKVACEAKPVVQEKRPAAISELSPGVWYVDLTRAQNAQLSSSYPSLSTAKGVIFDVRGYPTDAGFALLPHLVASAENDRWMHINRIVGPNGQSAGWQSLGWNVAPAPPRISGQVVFLTDGRAISYAESVMGYIADRKLGTIIGAPTAGANGNVVAFPVPGTFTVTFTGMKVTAHDGKATHHMVGVRPDIPLAPTIAGVRAGRDELLERAMAQVK